MKNYTEFIYESVTKSNVDKDYEKLSDIFYTFWTTLDDKLTEIENANSKNPQEVFKYNETIKKKSIKKGTTVKVTDTTSPTTTIAPVAPTKPVKTKQKTVTTNTVKQKSTTVAKNVTNPTITSVPKK